jgi:radical SAM superfamily enzyme YgiQ (UPF0313 family)
MIRKIIIFSQNNGTGFDFMKSASNLRMSYMLRSIGYEVKQVHNCLSFSLEEIRHIIENFAQGDETIACFSTSFISTIFRQNVYTLPNKDVEGHAWGLDAFTFLKTTCSLCKALKMPVLLGGWEIHKDKFKSDRRRFAWGFDALDRCVDYYITGNNIDIIDKLAKNQTIEYVVMNGSRLAHSTDILDFTDCASTPTVDDHIFEDESLSTEVAAGCIFSCQFCNYGALGKKKTEYMRSYESFERELVSNYSNFKTRMYLLTDNIMNDYEEKLKFLIKIREKTGADIRWTGYVRLDTIKRKEQAQLLLDSGIAGATFGIESFKKEAGPSVGKMTDKDRLMKSLDIFRDVIGDNCVTTASFISGLPTETPDDLNKTHEWLTSKEGKYYIDHFTFTALRLFGGNETKNEINISRNNPFGVYEKYDNDPGKWVSPWGSSETYRKLAYQYNVRSSSTIAAFSLPFLHNVGLKVENGIKLARVGDETKYQAVFTPLRKNYEKKIQLYKSKMLGM